MTPHIPENWLVDWCLGETLTTMRTRTKKTKRTKTGTTGLRSSENPTTTNSQHTPQLSPRSIEGAGAADLMGRSTMVTEIQCRIYAAECEGLGVARDISIQRATALMAMANSWQRLAADTGRYDAIVAEEGATG
jgi:hypothetical protein